MSDDDLDRPIWQDREERPEDLRRRPTVTRPCRRCGVPVTATASKLRPFCGWECGQEWQKLEERFLRKVGPPVVHVPALGPCTDWTGKLDDNGYGEIRQGDLFRGAHRVSYELAHGSVPDALMICHRCNRRICCNAKHLYAGTAVDNMRDLAIANAGSGSKTEWGDRLRMAQRLADGETSACLAAEYSVSEKTVRAWLKRFRDRDRVPDDLFLREQS